jgi:tetratricopeptide (TPR) repeat protein
MSAEEYNDLGKAFFQQQNLDAAVAQYRIALRHRPDFAEAHYNLALALTEQGNAYLQQGRLEEATACYGQVVRHVPHSAQAFYNLGLAFERRDQLDEAARCFQQAIRLDPNYAEALLNLGNLLARQNNTSEAIQCYREALRLNPEFVEAYNNLGTILRDLKQLGAAVDCYQQALRLRPDCASVHNNLGDALLKQGHADLAIASFQQAARLQPDSAVVYNNLGAAQLAHDLLADAAASFQNALRLQPDYLGAYLSLGAVMERQARPEDAIQCYEHALRIDPACAAAHWSRALLWLVLGDFERGWPAYEWRSTQADRGTRHPEIPHWDGSRLDGRTILLHYEQGLGDTLQFIRYAALVKQRGGKVIVECQPSLLPLLTGVEGIDGLLAEPSPLPSIDVQAPLLSLPGIFRTALETVPANIPYLHPNAHLVRHWRRELKTSDYLIGIVWQGDPRVVKDCHRSFPLVEFAPVAQLPGVRLVSLQKGPGTKQLREVADNFPVLDLGTELDEVSGAFMDTAAIMRQLDLVISSDTAIPHLAGALGVPVWVALPLEPDWRWLLERADSPWYPTMRLFRQRRYANWEEVFSCIAEELKSLMANRA